MRAATPGGWPRWPRPMVTTAASTSRAAPRAARVPHRPSWCWLARRDVTVWFATPRRAVRSNASSARMSFRPFSRDRAMADARAYIRDGAEIYRRSFAIIRAESDLARFNEAEERVAVRIIHACGMTEVARDIVMSKGFAERARVALLEGAPVPCHSRMVAYGITRAPVPHGNP